LLLDNALRAFWQSGAERVTLNTQTGNRSSRRLYQRFGFEPTGDLMRVWELPL
jgi:RimJ/RimL family protein N-acetyltransferase